MLFRHGIGHRNRAGSNPLEHAVTYIAVRNAVLLAITFYSIVRIPDGFSASCLSLNRESKIKARILTAPAERIGRIQNDASLRGNNVDTQYLRGRRGSNCTRLPCLGSGTDGHRCICAYGDGDGLVAVCRERNHIVLISLRAGGHTHRNRANRWRVVGKGPAGIEVTAEKIHRHCSALWQCTRLGSQGRTIPHFFQYHRYSPREQQRVILAVCHHRTFRGNPVDVKGHRQSAANRHIILVFPVLNNLEIRSVAPVGHKDGTALRRQVNGIGLQAGVQRGSL